MRSTVLAALLVVLTAPAGLQAQAMESAEPFKVGTFQIDGEAVVGLVLRDSLIVDIARRTPSWSWIQATPASPCRPTCSS